MRRIVAFGLASVLLLVSCTPKPRLPPEEVLRRSAQVSALLQSVRFESVGNAMWNAGNQSIQGSFDLQGVLQGGGEQVGCTLVLSLALPPKAGGTLRATVDVIKAGEGTVYIRLREVSGDELSGLFGEDGLRSVTGRWWIIPSSGEAEDTPTSVMSDPTLLRVQAAVVSVSEDMGMMSVPIRPGTGHGRRAYHYAVRIDPEKLQTYLKQRGRQQGEEEDAQKETLGDLQASGELWIDAQTFALLRARWTLEPLEIADGQTASASFTVDFSDFDAAPPIEIPEQAESLSPLLPPTFPSFDEEYAPPGFQEGVLRELLEANGQNSYTSP